MNINNFKKIHRKLFTKSIEDVECINNQYTLYILTNKVTKRLENNSKHGSKNHKLEENKKYIDQINEKIAFYRRTNLENIWQQIYLNARMHDLYRKMPGCNFDKLNILSNEIDTSYIKIIQTGC